MEFLPTASIDNIRYRSDLLRMIRRFFDDCGFIEVQTPVLSADTVVDVFVEPICVSGGLPLNYRGGVDYYLQTSPEFAMKRLLSAGLKSIYQICPVFRKGDRGKLHNIEFTMLEWYCVDDDYFGGRSRLIDLVRAIFSGWHSLQPERIFPSISSVTFDELFQKWTGYSFHLLDCAACRVIADAHRIQYPDSFVLSGGDDVDVLGWLDLIFSELIQPNLDGVVVYDYPSSQSQLARRGRDINGKIISERFELFLGGVEIANGYNELLDADELRERFQKTSMTRDKMGRSQLPVESRLLQAMQKGLPASSGTAVGVDRLMLYLSGAETIDQVMTFPIEYC
jgi:lysyl-tRNA synthetase class 2